MLLSNSKTTQKYFDDLKLKLKS